MVEPFAGAPDTSLYVEAKSDGRPFFIVPWLGMYLIGTTDYRFEGTPDQLKADNDEIDYLLQETNNIIPNAGLSREDVKFTYSGVRPLPNAEGKKAGSITRRHILFDHSKEGVKNLISLIGGKLTTYRQVGEEMVEKVYKKLGKSAPPCPTEDKPLPGAILPNDPLIQQTMSDYEGKVPRHSIDHLFKVYGAKAVNVLALVDSEPKLGELIIPELPDIKAQVVYAVRHEYAYTLVDIARRRTAIAMEAHYGLEALPSLIDTLKTYCGWDEYKCATAKENYLSYMKNNCIPDFDAVNNEVEPRNWDKEEVPLF